MESQSARTLDDLEKQLRDLSHSEEALEAIRAFASQFKSRERQLLLSGKNSLLRAPIFYEDAIRHDVVVGDDIFQLLQGDVIRTDSAYFLGSRVEKALYVVANSTCDLVRNRRVHGTLFRVRPIYPHTDNAKSLIGNALAFRSNKTMYLPPQLPSFAQSADTLGYLIDFDGAASIEMNHAFQGTRLASMTVIGWRIFGSFIRTSLVREAEGEPEIRSIPLP